MAPKLPQGEKKQTMKHEYFFYTLKCDTYRKVHIL